MAAFDLTSRLCEFLDRHLVFPLLEFLTDRDIYPEDDLLQAKVDLLSKTNMIDYLLEVYTCLHGPDAPPPDNMTERRDEVLHLLRQLQSKIEPIAKILEKHEVAEQLNNTRDRDGKQLLDYLVKNHDFHPDMLEQLYTYAKFKYDCGDYSATASYLHMYRLLAPSNAPNYLPALWGKLASEILVQKWEDAREELLKLKTYIDGISYDVELDALQQRSWLVHWGLFVFFNHEKGLDDILDLFLLSPNYLNTITIRCPHVLRYITAAVVINKKRRPCLKELVKVITLEASDYKDPMVEFIECLYVNYDFDGAQLKLRECETVLTNDFYLVSMLGEFIDCARLLIFEMFCRIHQTISISNLSEKLNMEKDEAERWIVNLIRNARLDAKIDSKLGHVTMGSKAKSIHEQVMENTKMLPFRAQSLSAQLEKLTVGATQWQSQQEKQQQQQQFAAAEKRY